MKGLAHLVEAASLLRDRGVDYRIQIAGDGPSRRDLQHLALERGIADRVVWLGHCSDMAAFYRDVDLVALPSVSTEGLPLSILEAMACGLPVVSTVLSGIPEVVVDGVTGRLVRPGDATALEMHSNRFWCLPN